MCRKQGGDDATLVRGRREAVSFWKRLQQHPAARDKIASFWKRAHPYDSLASFWKRGPPAGAGVQSFWKRFVETANDEDVAAMFARLAGPADTSSHERAADKKNRAHVSPPQQQRRAKEMTGRRPEFNPTGW